MQPGSSWTYQPPAKRVYTVSEFNEELASVLREDYPDVRIRGEVTNLRHHHQSGHLYFAIKDSKARISCVCFRRDAQRLGIKPEDGLEVVARGRIGIYSKAGRYEFYVRSIRPMGRGALQVAFERLKAQLKAEGLFDADRKKGIPPIPQRIGIVTSPEGAAIADMLRVSLRRFPGLWIRLFPVPVQGHGSAPGIARGIRYFSQHPWADVVIVGRGGGSIEDLWSFNEEIVARAIAECRVPVVSAVGHQTDFTISDFVADLRAPTPSAAAELVVAQASGVLDELTEQEDRIRSALSLRLERLRSALLSLGMERPRRLVTQRIDQASRDLDGMVQSLEKLQRDRLDRAGSALDQAVRKLESLDMRLLLAGRSRRLGEASQQMTVAMNRRLDRAAAAVQALSGELEALSPLAVLERGYAIVQAADGAAVREARQVAPADPLDVRLHRGRLKVRVETVEPDAADPAG